jgi:hypothetical protein
MHIFIINYFYFLLWFTVPALLIFLFKNEVAVISSIKIQGAQKMYTHLNVQNICLNNLLAYLQFNLENVHR